MNLSELLQFAVDRQQAGDLDQAEQAFRQVLAHVPGEVGVWHQLAWLLYRRGRPAEAVDALSVAIQARSDESILHAHRGVMLRGMGRAAEAVASFQAALRLAPNDFETHFNLGNAYAQLGQFPLAAESYTLALGQAPHDADIHLNLGVARKEMGQLAEARHCFEQALAIRPEFADAWVNLGIVAKVEGNYPDAIACYERALKINPRSMQAYNNLGSVYQVQRQLPQAVRCFEKALGINPDYSAAHANLAEAYQTQGKTEEARSSFRAAMRPGTNDALKIKAALVIPVIIQSEQQIAEVRERLTHDLDRLATERLSVRDPSQSIGVPAFCLAYQGHNDRQLQTQIARIISRATPALNYVAPHCQSPARGAPKPRIKVGFVSNHFHAHTIGKLNAGLIRELDRARFEVNVFRFSGRDDGMAQFISEGADGWLMLPPHLESAQAAIAEQRLDVLFFTDIGMDAWSYYLAHSRLAPVQCVTWGHPLTSGIPTVDYFLSSVDLEPEDAAEHYTERLVRLPHLTNYYYKPTPPRYSLAASHFGLEPDAHLYMCPQSLFKLHPQNDAVFEQILRHDPRATIVMLEGTESTWTEMLRARQFRAMGSLAERIRFIPYQSLPAFRQLLALADVMLDPLHFGGGDTSYEGFAVGTPIVTLPGGFLRSRITYAMYRAMGLDDCIALDAADYATRAVRLGTDRAWRRQVHDRILAANGVLYENKAAVRELEDFFQQAVAAV
jgi:predicted O-linked N-acetylglucosamine transferase (SPINDLY family)